MRAHRSRVIFFLIAVTVCRWTAAHHGASGVATTSGQGLVGPSGRPAVAGSRTFVFTGYSRLGTGPTPGATASLEASYEREIVERVSLSLAVPLLWQLPDDGQHELGLGSVQLVGKWTGLTDQRSVWTNTLRVGFPTQTATLGADPGAVWLVEPGLVWLHGIESWRLQAGFSLPFDTRPSGIALDAALGTRVGVGLWQRHAVYLGAVSTTRVATGCRRVEGGIEWCTSGRALEVNGDFLVPQVSGVAAWELRLDSSLLLVLSAEVAVTRARTSDWTLGLGALF